MQQAKEMLQCKWKEFSYANFVPFSHSLSSFSPKFFDIILILLLGDHDFCLKVQTKSLATFSIAAAEIEMEKNDAQECSWHLREEYIKMDFC